MGSKEEFPVFTETNLGTRIAVAISPDITAGKFKGELERAHIDCFPELGFLSIDAVMVKWDSYFYHLPDLLPLKHVFQGYRHSWFLYVNASLSKNLPNFKYRQNKPSAKAVVLGLETAYPSRKKKRRKRRPNKVKKLSSTAVVQRPALVVRAHPSSKKKRRKRRPKVKKKFLDSCSCERLDPESIELKGNTSNVCEPEVNGEQEVLGPSKASDSNATTAESPRESVSGAVSVSGIINKYFTNSINDVDDIGSAFSSEVTPRTRQCEGEKFHIGKKSSKKLNSEKALQRLLPSLLPEAPDSIALTNKEYERCGVGKRLVVASNNLGSSQRSALSKCKKLWDRDAGGPVIRSLVFEIDNND